MLIPCVRVFDIRVSDKSSDGAASARYIPDSSRLFVHDHRGAYTRGFCQLFEPQVVAFHLLEHLLRLFLRSEEHAVVLHPLRTPERGGFHIVGSLDNRDIDVLQFAVASVVLERREENGVGREVDDCLDGRSQSTSAISDGSLFALFDHPRQVDVLQVADTTDALLLSQRLHQSAVYTGGDDRLFQGDADQCAFWQVMGFGLVGRNKDIRMQCLAAVPRVGKLNGGITIIANHRKIRGVFQVQRVAIGACRAVPTARTRRKDGWGK